MSTSSETEHPRPSSSDAPVPEPRDPLARTVLARVEAQILCLEWLAATLDGRALDAGKAPADTMSPWSGACAALDALATVGGPHAPRTAMESAATECGALLGRIAHEAARGALATTTDSGDGLRAVYDRYVEVGETLYAEAVRSGEVAAALRPLLEALARR